MNGSEQMENNRICPKCGKEYNGYPALSRKDNKLIFVLHVEQGKLWKITLSIKQRKKKMKILTKDEVKKLKDALYIGQDYYEWQDWDDLVEQISHKYIKDNGELKYFEAELENIGVINVSKIDNLIYDVLKNKFICL